MILEEEERLSNDEHESKDERPAVGTRAVGRRRTHLILNLQDDVNHVAQREPCRHFNKTQTMTDHDIRLSVSISHFVIRWNVMIFNFNSCV